MTILNYTFNYIDAVFIVIMLLMTVAGFFRGIFLTLVNFIRYSVGIFLCFFFADTFSQTVYDSYVKARLVHTIEQSIVNTSNADEIVANIQSTLEKVPDFLKNTVDVSSVNLSSKDLTNSILVNVFEPVALVLVKAAIFVATFLVFFIATGVLIHIIKSYNHKKDHDRDKKSPLRTADRIFGGVFGFLKSAVVVLAITSILMYILELGVDALNANPFFAEVKNSKLIEVFHSVNPFNAITEGLLK